MTNRQLLHTPEQLLTELDRQRLFLLRVDGTPMPCPACKKPVNLFEAAGIDLDQYDFGNTSYSCCCPGCGAKLEQVISFIAGGGALWHWELQNAWLQDQLQKAKAFDRQSGQCPGPG
jgi:uncharacterized protein (UPF0212 family)